MTVHTIQQWGVLDLVTSARFSDALELLGADWPGLGVEPGERSPELLFSIGLLNTNLGFSEQHPIAQEVAKNCFSRAARGLKGDARDLAEIQLAIVYWRTGDEEEALIQLDEIRQRPLSKENLFRTLHVTAVVKDSSGRFKEAHEHITQARTLLDDAPIALRGRFHNEAAANLRSLGGDHVDQCLNDYTAALVYYEQCGANTLEVSARNNLAEIYCDVGDYKQAHRHVERAIEIGTKLQDKGRVAQCYDTQAQIFLAQGQPVRAAQSAHDSIKLIGGSAPGWAIDCRITYAKALARTADPRAVDEFSIAIQTARRQENRHKECIAALSALEELDLDVSLMLEWFPVADRAENRKRVSAVRRKLANKLEALSDYEDVKLALIEHRGNITHAAKALGYSHHTGLLSYLNKHPELRIRKPYRRSKSKR